MNHSHPINKNIHIYQGTKFNGADLIPNYKFITEYLQSIEMVIVQALIEHPRLMILRFDLHYPVMPSCPDHPNLFPHDVIGRFIASLTAKYDADLKRKSKEGKRIRQKRIHYLWAKETNISQMPHYHVALFLSSDAYNALGDKDFPNSNAGRVTAAWASALAIDSHQAYNLVHIPKDKPIYYLNINSESYIQTYNDTFKRLSYLAKSETKHYNNSGKSFGHSRICHMKYI
jgi:hypothetical protein